MSREYCGAEHPELPTVVCTRYLDRPHPEHTGTRPVRFPPRTEAGPGSLRAEVEFVDWPNTDYRPPPPGPGAHRQVLKDLAAQVPKRPRYERRDDPGAFANHTLSGHDDSAVQLAGAGLALPRSGLKRRIVYDLLASRGPDGATFDELVDLTGWTYSKVGPRVRELCGADGKPVLVRDSGRTRSAHSGAQQVVWTVCP